MPMTISARVLLGGDPQDLLGGGQPARGLDHVVVDARVLVSSAPDGVEVLARWRTPVSAKLPFCPVLTTTSRAPRSSASSLARSKAATPSGLGM